MNKIKWLILLLVFITNANSITAQTKTTSSKVSTNNDLSFLKKLVGKYPTGLLEHPKLKTRLKKMMELNYDFINKEAWQTLIQNRIEGNYFIAEGMQLHSGGDPSACIFVDLTTNEIFVAVRNQLEYLYSEKTIEMPDIVKKWAINTYPPSTN